MNQMLFLFFVNIAISISSLQGMDKELPNEYLELINTINTHEDNSVTVSRAQFEYFKNISPAIKKNLISSANQNVIVQNSFPLCSLIIQQLPLLLTTTIVGAYAGTALSKHNNHDSFEKACMGGIFGGSIGLGISYYVIHSAYEKHTPQISKNLCNNDSKEK